MTQSIRTLTQPSPSIEYDDAIVDFGAEDIGRKHARNPAALQAEVDGIREAIRLNWLELDRSELSRTDRRAIRANVARLDRILIGLLTLRDSAVRKSYLVAIKFAQGVRTFNPRYATVGDALLGAAQLLRDGAPGVCIIDSEGNLILPADQLHLRLKQASGYVGVA
jgi:hypothetical protein